MSKTTKTFGKPLIVFFGSGPVAAKSLELLSHDFSIEAVVTKPKPAHHRGNFPVLETAHELGLKILTASNKNELSEIFTNRALTSSVAVLIDFGIIVTQDVIDYFPNGIVNSHFSVLPEWRGADPITFAILSGQKTTGVSLMLLVRAMDEGPLITYGEYPIPKDITAPKLTDELIELSNKLIRMHLPDYIKGVIKPRPQDITGRETSYSRKLTKEDGIIDWNKPAEVIEREVRAFIEWPKSRSEIAGKEAILTNVDVINATGIPGKATANSKELMVYCGAQALRINKLKPAGKNEMTGEAFLAGHSKYFEA